MEDKNKITTFTDLKAWQQGHKLAIDVYKCVDTFPKKETFGLSAQMQRAAVSITSNIAEGFSRQTYKEKAQFYSMAQGSVTEIQNQLLLARDIGYVKTEKFDVLSEQSITVHKLLNGLIKTSKTYKSNS